MIRPVGGHTNTLASDQGICLLIYHLYHRLELLGFGGPVSSLAIQVRNVSAGCLANCRVAVFRTALAPGPTHPRAVTERDQDDSSQSLSNQTPLANGGRDPQDAPRVSASSGQRNAPASFQRTGSGLLAVLQQMKSA